MTTRIPRTHSLKCNSQNSCALLHIYSLAALAALFNFHFDLLRLCRLALGYVDLQQAVFELGPNLGRIGPFRQVETPRETPKRALRAMIPLFLVFSLELSFAMNHEHALLDIDMEIFSLHFRQVGFHEKLLFVLDDIHRRRPGGKIALSASPHGRLPKE